jgi:hypothetical protein
MPGQTNVERTSDLARWLQSVIKVGDGRGFVMADDREQPVVVTAAHCLPYLPPASPARYTWERTYGRLLGPLGGEPTISAEILFMDPVADIAILARPDTQEMLEQAKAYDMLVETALPLGEITVRARNPHLSERTDIPGPSESRGGCLAVGTGWQVVFMPSELSPRHWDFGCNQANHGRHERLADRDAAWRHRDS